MIKMSRSGSSSLSLHSQKLKVTGSIPEVENNFLQRLARSI